MAVCIYLYIYTQEKWLKRNEWGSEGSTVSLWVCFFFKKCVLKFLSRWGRSEGKICWLGFKTSACSTRRRLSSAQSVLVVGLLLARAGDAVLGLAGARAQAVQSPAVLGVIDVVLEEKLEQRKQEISASRPIRKLNGCWRRFCSSAMKHSFSPGTSEMLFYPGEIESWNSLIKKSCKWFVSLVCLSSFDFLSQDILRPYLDFFHSFCIIWLKSCFSSCSKLSGSLEGCCVSFTD